ncbi:MAG TPA: hypothetical protein VMT87_01160 [Vicinamibacteria bacterium]|nr:hypothetical protein [Vicinamibacteria bacterium]
MHNLLEQTLRYALFALLAIGGPGLALQRLARVAPDPALVIPLGTAVAAAAYWLSAVTALPWLFPAAVAALDLALLLPPRPLRPAAAPSLAGAVPPAIAIVLLLAATQFAGNRVASSGEFLLDPLVPQDTAFHVGLTRELAAGYPPQVPGVSGFPLGYHLGLDLVRAAALRFAGVDPYHAISRCDVTLGALALVLALRGAARAAGGAALAVALAPWTLLATDFSFVFAANPQAHWWTDLLRGNVLLSLAVSNPIVPALALALGALVALARHQEGEGRGWLALAALQAAAVPFFKVFLGAHLLLGLGLAMVLARGRRARALAALAAPCALATAALVFGQGGRTLDVALAPLDLVRETRELLGLDPLDGAGLALWAVFWLTASLGLRLLGLPVALQAARSGPSAARTMAWMALFAWPLGLLFRVSAPRTLPGQKPFNDAYVLIEQGGPLLWIFTAIALSRLARGGRRTVAVVAAAALLCLPSTAQFAWKKATEPPDPMPAGIVRAMAALSAASRPGEVVMQRPGARYPPPPVVLAGRRVPYERFTPFMAQFVAPEDLERRHQAVHRFFRTNDRAEAIAIARSLDARYLCLYGPDRVRFDTTGLLAPIHEEPQARCYRLTF